MFTQWEKADIIRNAYRNDKGGDSMAQVNKETTIGELLMTSGDKIEDVARALMEPGKEAYEAVCAFLGPKILLEDGQINRSAMAEIIFKDPSKRAKVDSLTHPLVWKAVKKEAEEYNRQSVVIEAAIPSKEFRDICDEMWYLYTSREERIRRLKESRGYSDEKIAGIMANQASEEEFRNFTDCEINNSGTEEETSLQIQKLLCGKDNETA